MKRASLRDLAILTAVCAIAYLPGLTHRGVVNWQEGIRLLASQEMHARGSWVVPTIHGEPYLAKPPLIYWSVRALSPLTGGEVSLATLRLSVAMGAWLGVLLTYIAARRLLDDGEGPPPRSGAMWSALLLASGLLYTRSARIGELDIWLVPCVTLATIGIWDAYRSHLLRRRTSWGGLLLASIGSIGAALTKGPPGLVVPAMVYAGLSLHAFFSKDLRPPIAETDAQAQRFARRATGWFIAMSRAHPVGVLGIALLGLWVWGRAVGAEIGPEAVQAAASREAGDNLVMFQLRPWTRSLEAMSYGVGLGSLIGAAGYAWWLIKRPHLPAGAWVLLGWCTLAWIVFCMFSSGTGRYLTPIWPGIAIFAGWCLATWIRRRRAERAWCGLAVASIAALVLAQVWWYGFAPAARSAPRSPTPLIEELVRIEGVDRDRIASLDFWHAGLSAGAGDRVLPIADLSIGDADYFVDFPGRPAYLSEFLADVRASQDAWTVLVVDGTIWDGTDARDRLAVPGILVERIELDREMKLKADGISSDVAAYRIRAARPRP